MIYTPQELREALMEARRNRLADINLAISHLGQIYGLLNEGKADEASDYCRAAADSWTQDIAELDAVVATDDGKYKRRLE